MPHIPGSHSVIDITYRGARLQSDILKENPQKLVNEETPEAPTSLTPEQLENYCLQYISSTGDQKIRRVYAELARIIRDYSEVKNLLRQYQLKELRDTALKGSTPDDIQV